MDQGSKPTTGTRVEWSLLPQPTKPPSIFSLIVRVARDAPIVRVAHGWGCGVEAYKK